MSNSPTVTVARPSTPAHTLVSGSTQVKCSPCAFRRPSAEDKVSGLGEIFFSHEKSVFRTLCANRSREWAALINHRFRFSEPSSSGCLAVPAKLL